MLFRSGRAELQTNWEHGANAPVLAVHGSTSTTLDFGTAMVGGGSICSATRYVEGGKKRRILNAGGSNWFHGHYNDRAGVAHYNGWATSYSYIVTPNTDWVLMCSDGASKVRLYTARGVLDNGNGDKRSSDGVTGLYINGETSEKSDFAVAELITWDRPLSEVEMVQMLSHLAQQSTSSLPARPPSSPPAPTTELNPLESDRAYSSTYDNAKPGFEIGRAHV